MLGDDSDGTAMLASYDGSAAAARDLELAARLAIERGAILEVTPVISRRSHWLLAVGEGLADFAPIDSADLLASLGAEADRELHRIATGTHLSWRILSEPDPPAGHERRAGTGHPRSDSTRAP